MSPEEQDLYERLRAPFEPAEVKWKPQVVSGSRAMAIAYVDARVIQDRLNEVLGVLGWQDKYDCLPDGNVVCRLSVRFWVESEGAWTEWVSREDVGGPSEQPDEGDRRKAAFSDALKRAAVKFGIARYIYSLPHEWVDFDPAKKRITGTPKLPTWALPRAGKQPSPPPAAEQQQQQQQQQSARNISRKDVAKGEKTLPADGVELKARLEAREGLLVRDGLCRPGELLEFVADRGEELGWGGDISQWATQAIAASTQYVREFVSVVERHAAERRA